MAFGKHMISHSANVSLKFLLGFFFPYSILQMQK